MSSNFLTRSFDVKRFGLIYAGAQKNVGIAGLTIVIIRNDLLDQANSIVPITYHYKTMADNQSLYNTPPCFAIYITSLYLKHIKNAGGLAQMERNSISKSKLVYNVVANSKDFYVVKVSANCRSRVNIPFRVGGASGNLELEKKFLDETAKRGMLQLKGHRSVGGIRVSLYNAIRLDEAQDFANFMIEFQEANQ